MSEFKLTTEFNDEIIKQHLDFQGEHLIPRVEEIIKLKEQGVKEALSKLGYLNPDEAKELKRERDSTKARLEEALEVAEGCRNFMLGMHIDPSLSSEQKIALRDKANQVDAFLTNQNTDKE